MRLEILSNSRLGQRSTSQRRKLALATRIAGSDLGPLAVLSYRPEFCGAHYASLIHRVLHTPQGWTRGEVELFAAFVSKQNRCAY